MSKRRPQASRAAQRAVPASSETRPAPGPEPASRLLRIAVIVALVGLFLLALFLIFGFLPWTVGIGMFIGMPLIVLAMLLYAIAVVVDLRRRGAL
jgi:hypothetical protein